MTSRLRHLLAPCTVLFLLPSVLFAQRENWEKTIQYKLDSMCTAGHFPGLTLGIALPDHTLHAFAAGFADVAKQQKMETSAYLMQGSVGKTYVSAVALQLIKEKKLDLNAKASDYLGSYPWFGRLPNAADITVRMLMQHTSGVMRYEFKDQFTKDLTNHPGKVWKPEELLSYVLDEKAPFKAGEGWDYSDTNYIILALVLEKITGKSYYQLAEERIWKPLHLEETLPSDKRKLKGLVQGYAGNDNPFGGKNEVMDNDGNFIINPQFEWTGGGVYSTSKDLAKWGQLLYEGKAFDPALLPVMLEGVPAPMLGNNTKYGLGVIIHESQKYGTFYGHSGFFPGYQTEMYYFPKYKAAFAVQTNSSDFRSLKMRLLTVLIEAVKATFESDNKQ